MRHGATHIFVIFILFFSAAAALASEQESQPEAMLIDRTVTGPVKITVDNSGKATVRTGGREVAFSNLIKVRFTGPESRSSGGKDEIEVHYLSGDVLHGIYDGGGRETLKFNNQFLGMQEESIEDLKAVFFTDRIPPVFRGFRESCLKRATENDDLIFLKAEPDNPVSYTVHSFSTDAIGLVVWFEDNSSIVYRDIEHISAVVFYQEPEEKEEKDQPLEGSKTGPEITVYLSDGSRITGRIRGLDSDKLTMTWLGGNILTIPTTAIATVYFSNTTYAFLSDLDPAEVNETLYFQKKQEWPWRRDRSVKRGLPLTIRKQVFHKGLGVHSRSALTYELGGEYETFMATIGLDDEVIQEANNGREGNVTFRVIGDGRTLFEEKDVTVSDQPKPVRISVRGVRRLTLLVDFGKNFHVQDRADWAEPVLIRKSE